MDLPSDPAGDDDRDRPHGFAAIFRRIVNVHDDEAAAVAWSFSYFFFLMAGYYVLRSLRDAMGIAGGVKQLPLLFMGTLTVVTLCNPLYAALVSRFARRRLIPIVYRFFQLNLLAFFLLFEFVPPERQIWVARAFFVGTSVFNLFAVTVFWSLMADLFSSEQGKRLFGFVGLGGTLGAAAGAWLNTQLAEALGVEKLVLVSLLLLELAVWSIRRLVRRTARGDGADASGAEPTRERPLAEGGVFDALVRVFYSPYLLGIGSCMLAYTISTTFLYFEQGRIVEAAMKSNETRTVYLARIDLYINLVTVVMQLFLTARIIRSIGVGASMAAVPLATLVGFIALIRQPTTEVLFWFQVVKNAANYGLARPAREVLYTVVRPEEKYKSKSFIDTFIFRAGDAIGAGAYKLLTGPVAAGLATSAGHVIGGVVAVMMLVWVVLCGVLGSQQNRLALGERAAQGA
jgi:AAA family ATP:ADP antiporter